MPQQLTRFFIFLAIFLVLTGISHLLYRLAKIPSEVSRKFLHVSGGFLALFIPLFFKSHWWVLCLCLLAFVFLLVTFIKQWLPAVHQTIRRSFGSVLFPIPVYICFLVATASNDMLLFYLPVSLLTVSDTVAEWSGKKWGVKSIPLMNGKKSLAGTLGFAICSLLLATGICMIYDIGYSQLYLTVALVTIVATIAEMVSIGGFDNVSVPLSALTCLYLLR